MERGTATNSKKESATSTMYDASSITGAPQRLDLTLEVTLTNGGNAAFDFSLPFHPGQILTPQITSTSKGATLTLEKVLLAPSGSLITIKGLDDPGPLDAMLKAPDGHITGFLHYGMRDSKAIFSFSEKAPVANQPGRWTLTLSRTPVANDPNEDPHLIPRTWTFVFIVP
jgi:hypothetical protein